MEHLSQDANRIDGGRMFVGPNVWRAIVARFGHIDGWVGLAFYRADGNYVEVRPTVAVPGGLYARGRADA